MGKLNSSSLLSREANEIIVKRRDAVAVYSFIAVLAPLYLGFGTYRSLFMTGFGQQIGFFEMFLGLFVTGNAIIYRRHQRGDIVKPIMSALTGILCYILLISGGTASTGIYWSFVLQATNSHFLGRRVGLIFSSIFTAGFLLLGCCGPMFLPFANEIYDRSQVVQAGLVLIAIYLLTSSTKKAQDEYETTVLKQRKQIRAILGNLPAGIIMIVPPSGRPEIVNDALERMLGRDVEPNGNLDDFIRDANLTDETGRTLKVGDTAFSKALLESVEASNSRVFITRPDGSRIVTRLIASPITNAAGKTISVVGIFEDMTKEHDIDRLKTELVSLASHQLKTPMTGVKWAVESLLGGDAGKVTKRQNELMQPVLDVIRRLLDFIGDLLSVSRIESGRKFDVVPKPTDVVPILKGIRDELKLTAEQRGVKFHLDLPNSLRLMADEAKFREALTNLVGNAIKYCKPDGHVTVRLKSEDLAEPILAIEDDGIGIPKAQQDKIFNRFFRADNVDANIEGTGLGLYIVKEIIERHGGSVWFDSSEGQGTTFFVKLPTPPDASTDA